jgi:ribonucleoside-diphosphate reductase beta chain
MSVLDPRENYLPFEYPKADYFVDKINHSYWLHSEVTFDSDALEFSRLSPDEAGIMKRAMLAISQIEVAVKMFWGNLYNLFPKPEFHNVAMTFGDSEARHSALYSRLLTVLGFEEEFTAFLSNPIARGRYDWLNKPRNNSPADIAYNVAVFSMLVENVSLFSQFLIMLHYRRSMGVMKNIANGVGWTAQDETVHFETGAWIISVLREEFPEIDEKGFAEKMREVAREAIDHEQKMVDYILDGKELTGLSRAVIMEFIKDRLNQSLKALGIDPVFDCDNELLKQTSWFDEMVLGTTHRDFFDVVPVEYSIGDTVFTAEELF